MKTSPPETPRDASRRSPAGSGRDKRCHGTTSYSAQHGRVAGADTTAPSWTQLVAVMRLVELSLRGSGPSDISLTPAEVAEATGRTESTVRGIGEWRIDAGELRRLRADGLLPLPEVSAQDLTE